jgi:hypothetical protein
MNGTWQGPYSGTNTGQLVVEIDDVGDHFKGAAYAYDNTTGYPSSFALIETPDKSRKSKFKVPLAPLDPRTGEPALWQDIASLFASNITFPQSADVECEWDDARLKISWVTNIGTSGSADIPKSKADQPSVLKPLPVSSWDEFKKHVASLEQYRYIYRGQKTTMRLRTPFHRTGRGDMRNFFLQDIPVLHRALSARTKHVFNLNDPFQNAAFLNMVQHHGYPTPLLDWTYSPFVAAYFAYHRVSRADAAKAKPADKVRIFLFDAKEWRKIAQILNVSVRWQHFSLVEPIAIENERLIPQQALSSFTTVDDIETYIATKEAEMSKGFLQVIDLPLSERDLVIRELTLMGVTAGSLFPGLDGTCEEMRERFFSY